MLIKRPVIPGYHLEGICKSIGDTESGLKGGEIGVILKDNKIDDVTPDLTKWKRLYNAFMNFQNKNQCSNNILDFLKYSLQPARYVGSEEIFQNRRHEINKRLSFIGVEISDRGTLREVSKAVTVSDAEQRASHYKYKLENRSIHPEIIKYCNPELLVENYFHSVFEATKSVSNRLREMTGLHADGNALVETAFSTSNPLIRVNYLKTETDRNEHIGLMNLVKGVFGFIRNPTAHAPKIKFVIEEEDALDWMTIISAIHKKLDKAL
jgi:uncharacterized protein (TIGR02391 family)